MEISDALKKRVSRISAAEVDAAFLAVTQPSVESNQSDAVDAFADIITEAIRHGSSAIEFTYVLQDAGVDASTVRHAQDQYTAQQTSLTAQMSRMRIRSSACPLLQTMNWRLDWIVKGSSAERSTHPMYTLSFQGKDGSEFTVQATREELVDLSSKCKEALRSAERHVK